MKRLLGLFACLFAAGVLVVPALAQDQAALCDAEAASPYDPDNQGNSGVEFFDIEPIGAIGACLSAVKADPDNRRLRYQLARAYDLAEDFEKALHHYGVAHDQGSAAAAAGLAGLYEYGLGIDTDETEAARLYEEAVAAGIRNAMERLGKIYEDGRGVTQDHQRAAQLYQQAADAGSMWAVAALGWLTENGWGVSQDLEKAAELYAQSAEAGVDFAQNNLATFYAEGLGGISQDHRRAVQLYTQAADQGLVLAYMNLAIHYSEGEGVKRSLARAEEYLRRAIEEGEANEVARASNNLAWMFATEGIKLDEAEDLARSAVAADPGDANWLDTLAWVLHKDGRNEEALSVISEALTLDKHNSEIRAHRDAIAAALEG